MYDRELTVWARQGLNKLGLLFHEGPPLFYRRCRLICWLSFILRGLGFLLAGASIDPMHDLGWQKFTGAHFVTQRHAGKGGNDDEDKY